MKVLVTGGAGFIGSYLCEELIAAGHDVTVFDSFHAQIHGSQPCFDRPWLKPCEVIRESVENRDALYSAAISAEVVVHLAAETGTGQSMQEVSRYSSVNLVGTTNLAHLIANKSLPNLKRVVIASSRAIYGEGKYNCANDGVVYPKPRSAERMLKGQFDPVCPMCGGEVELAPTDETSLKQPSSFYGLSKQFQEDCLTLICDAAGISCAALRFQNVYGPRQSLNNPYTGVLTVFARNAFHGRRINVFEDGKESRDFVYVTDVVAAIVGAISFSYQSSLVLNVGTGVGVPLKQLAEMINLYYGGKSDVYVSGDFRVGDIRHNVADIAAIGRAFGYSPKIAVDEGVGRFCDWARAELEAELQ
ncbi:MAG TPA: NAD-dependent epimerase/dehydratase family protein [Chthoniobacterales bacterium]